MPSNLWQTQLASAAQLVYDIQQDDMLQQAFIHWVEICSQALENGNKLLFVGNGGSAADAQHLAAELVVRFKHTRRGLPALALTVDTSALTAIGNDFGFDYVFSRQVEALGNAGDVLIAMSTSGQSANVIQAAKMARDHHMTVVGLTGKSGGALAGLAHLALKMPSDDTPRIQEGHALLGHMLCDVLEQRCIASLTV